MKRGKPEFFYDVEQRSAEWRALRAKLITASDFGALLANGDGRENLIKRVACEIVTGDPSESYENDYMRRGRAMEAEARAKFAMVYDVEPIKIGFVRRGKQGDGGLGASPDSLIGKNRVLEIKTEKAEILVETFKRNEFPTKHINQTQGQLGVCEYDKVDLAIHCRGMPLFYRESGRDERKIKQIEDASDRAWEEIARLVQRIRGWGAM